VNSVPQTEKIAGATMCIASIVQEVNQFWNSCRNVQQLKQHQNPPKVQNFSAPSAVEGAGSSNDALEGTQQASLLVVKRTHDGPILSGTAFSGSAAARQPEKPWTGTRPARPPWGSPRSPRRGPGRCRCTRNSRHRPEERQLAYSRRQERRGRSAPQPAQKHQL
jgi:hypothetical protein